MKKSQSSLIKPSMPPVSTQVTTKTVTGTKLAVATGFLAVAAGLAIASTTSTPPTPPPKTQAGCVDSETTIPTSTPYLGDDITVAGTTFFTTSKQQQSPYPDTCSADKKTLTEYFCGADGKVKSKNIDCATALKVPAQCVQGACKSLGAWEITDLIISDIAMNEQKLFIPSPTSTHPNKITVYYSQNYNKAPDKPFNIILNISPAIPDLKILQLTGYKYTSTYDTKKKDWVGVLSNFIFSEIGQKKVGVYEIPVFPPGPGSGALSGLNVTPYSSSSKGFIQVFFAPFLPPKNFTGLTITASIDSGKVIDEWDEKNNTKKVTIPAANIKLAEPPKPSCTLNGTALAPPENYKIVTSITYTENGKTNTTSDKCDKGKLVEYSCNSDGTKKGEVVTCSSKFGKNAVCSNGICVVP